MMSIFHLAACSTLWDFEINLAMGDHIVNMDQFLRMELNMTMGYEKRGIIESADVRKSEAKLFIDYHERIMEEVSKKKHAGFPVSLTDYWARALSRKLIDEEGDMGVTWSDIVNTQPFVNYEAPFPIAIALVHDPNLAIHSSRSTIIEFSPFEFGSWDHKVRAFSDIKYLGTRMINWSPVSADACVQGYDNASFIMATSSSLFNDLLLLIIRHSKGWRQRVLSRFRGLLDGIPGPLYNREYALYPNPFYSPIVQLSEEHNHDMLKRTGNYINPFTNSQLLLLGDGGQDGQNLPLDPLLRPERQLDVILTIDASSDVNNYPNGTALRRPVGRYHSQDDYMKVPYPEIPPEETLLELNPYNLPRFFGCNLESYPTWNYNQDVLPPLLVYIPNREYTFDSNTSTTKLTYSREESLAMVENGYYLVNRPYSKDWSRCVGCAILSREFYRQQLILPHYCKLCFKKYCIN